MSQLYTNSRLRVLRDCLRRHYYQYVLNVRTPSSWQMDFGTTFHAALEAYFIAWRSNPSHVRVVDGVEIDERLEDALLTIDSSRFSAFDRAKLRALVVAYHVRWGSEPWDVLGVECEFRYELPDDRDEEQDAPVVGGKIDAIVRNRETGLVYVLEHKTTGTDATPGSAYWAKLELDSQISIYIDGAAVLGHEIAGCIYDVVRRPEHEQLQATPLDKRQYTQGKGCKLCGGNLQGKQGSGSSTATTDGKCAQCKGHGWRLDAKGEPEAPRLYAKQRDRDETLDEFEDRLVAEIAERPDDFLIRNVVVRLDSELPRMRRALRDTIRYEQVTTAARLRIPNTDACARYGQLCPFFAVCAGRASIDDPILFPRAERSHPELASAA